MIDRLIPLLFVVVASGGAPPSASATDAPLGGYAATDWLWVGGEARFVHEVFFREGYGTLPQDDTGSWMLRLMPRVGLRLDPHVFVHVELLSALQTGRDDGPGPFDEDRLALHQGYVELDSSPGSEDAPRLSARLGRQELRYGAGRLMDVRDGPTVRRSFDAIVAEFATAWIDVEAFFGAEVPVNPDVFDNGGGDRPLAWGGYVTVPLSEDLPQLLEVYYLGLHQDGLEYTSGLGSEVRHSVGARWAATTDRVRADIEATAQFGALDAAAGRRRILAWGVAVTSAYTFADATRPTLSLGGGITSGDADPSDARLGTFRSGFPNLRFAGASSRVGPSNGMGLTPGFSVTPTPGMLLSLTGRLFWRTRRSDRTYSVAGFSHPESNDDRFVGGGGTFVVAADVGSGVSLTLMGEVFHSDHLRVEWPTTGLVHTAIRYQL